MLQSCAARLTGSEIPSFADAEKTFPELQDRIAKTVAYLKPFNPSQFDGSAERIITMNIRRKPVTLDGKTYLLAFSPSRCPTSSSTSPPPTTSFATKGWRSARWIISVAFETWGGSYVDFILPIIPGGRPDGRRRLDRMILSTRGVRSEPCCRPPYVAIRATSASFGQDRTK